jgi:hypothetical protein
VVERGRVAEVVTKDELGARMGMLHEYLGV